MDRAQQLAGPGLATADDCDDGDDDDVYYYSFHLNCIGQRLKLEGKTENTGVCTKEQEGMTAGVLMATPCIKLKMMKMMFITISARD